MNPFSLNHKNPQTRIPQRLKIKSKYFGQYEPQVFIASKSKSKSRSTSKDDINNLITKKSPLNYQAIKIEGQQRDRKAQTVTINLQTSKSSRSFDSGSLSEYLLARRASSRRRKQGSAIEMIVEWVERRYFQKIKNLKIDKDTSLSFLQDNKFTQTSQKQYFQEFFKKFAYDAFILSRLKGAKYMKANSLGKGKKSLIIYNENPKHESKQNDIDNMNMSPVKQVSKVEDFDIYKFKKNPNYTNDANLMRISQLSIENIHRSSHKIASNSYLPDKEQFSSGKHKFDIPTMNTLQNLDIKDGKFQSQKDFQIGNIENKNKVFFVETARSTSTNQMMELSKNSISQNSMNDKEILIHSKEMPKAGPLHKGDLKISTNITKDSEQIQVKENQHLLARHNLELRAANNFEFVLSKKLKNQTELCQLDNWPNSLFHPEKLPQAINPTQTDTMSILEERGEQILNQIFQMNHDQQHILKTIGLNQNSQLFNSKKQSKTQTIETPDSIINKIQPNNDSQISKSRKSFAENYFSMHLAVNQQPNQVKTYQMPLAKANTNLKVKIIQDNPSKTQNPNTILAQNKSPNKEVFTFNSLSPQNNTRLQTTKKNVYPQNKKTQANAFAQKCNIFGLCSGEGAKQLDRSNYFTQISTSGRQRGISTNSNQSKTSSKPKVSFNYISPSSKQINMLSKEGESLILFKSQAQHLKNVGKAPVKIQIKPSRERKQNEGIQESIVKKVVTTQVRQLRSESIVVEQKGRNQSVRHFAGHKGIISNQQVKVEPIIQYAKVNTQQKAQNKNVFVSAGYCPSYYYQSQKSIPNPPHTQGTSIHSNYQSAQSYYFPGMVSPPMANTQTIPSKCLPLGPTIQSKKDKQPISHRNGHRYLYPIQQSVEKQRNERAKSLCQKIFVTVKKNQC